MARGTSFPKRLAQQVEAFRGGSRLLQQFDAAMALERACGQFGLNPDKPSDRRKLLKELAFVCFPPPGQAGRRREWTGERLCQLLSDVKQTRSQYRCSDKKACELIVEESLFESRYKGQRPGTLRRRLQDATDPKRNAVLDTMVTNRGGPPAHPARQRPRVRRRAAWPPPGLATTRAVRRRRHIRGRTWREMRAYLRRQKRAEQKVVKKCIALISSSWRRQA